MTEPTTQPTEPADGTTTDPSAAIEPTVPPAEPGNEEQPQDAAAAESTETPEVVAVEVHAPGSLELITVDGDMTATAALLLEIAQALGMHPHVVDYSPRVGGFFVPVALAQAYATQAADITDEGPVAKPDARPRQVRDATIKKATTAKKAAARKKAGD
jgi:hypothetical protein